MSVKNISVYDADFVSGFSCNANGLHLPVMVEHIFVFSDLRIPFTDITFCYWLFRDIGFVPSSLHLTSQGPVTLRFPFTIYIL
jgi:hypothetical protein